MKLNTLAFTVLLTLGLTQAGCGQGQGGGSNDENTQEYTQNPAHPERGEADSDSEDIADHIHNDGTVGEEIQGIGCIKPSTSQKDKVNLGFTKKDAFLQQCAQATNGSFWCDQIVRPNPRSASTFRCTYGTSQPHNLIHPDERTWSYPIEAVKILQDLTSKGIKVSHIYNWWRPEPYNKNVGGAAGRHPYGTSVDVRFASNSEADRAFRELCKMRAQKRLRAIGHYGSSSLHLGVGDKTANTWGKSCG